MADFQDIQADLQQEPEMFHHLSSASSDALKEGTRPLTTSGILGEDCGLTMTSESMGTRSETRFTQSD